MWSEEGGGFCNLMRLFDCFRDEIGQKVDIHKSNCFLRAIRVSRILPASGVKSRCPELLHILNSYKCGGSRDSMYCVPEDEILIGLFQFQFLYGFSNSIFSGSGDLTLSWFMSTWLQRVAWFARYQIHETDYTLPLMKSFSFFEWVHKCFEYGSLAKSNGPCGLRSLITGVLDRNSITPFLGWEVVVSGRE